ncbi:hypothetical protein [Lysinibacillus sp. G4S2]|uniref:hypothetical protein n=1 Tax=Lysinibacillus sp. G4S2 TaxID=3055859 RepID=UPI0025A18661|nr:hypothetical protein [Lysinibacillus sp. G4S2]MDM5246788.1 hypothetical protein [Lysinibacillus sp. G4S2]
MISLSFALSILSVALGILSVDLIILSVACGFIRRFDKPILHSGYFIRRSRDSIRRFDNSIRHLRFYPSLAVLSVASISLSVTLGILSVALGILSVDLIILSFALIILSFACDFILRFDKPILHSGHFIRRFWDSFRRFDNSIRHLRFYPSLR